MAEEKARSGNVAVPQTESSQIVGFPSQASASVEGFTGRYIVMSKDGSGGKTKTILERETSFKISTVAGADEPNIDAKSIPENEGLLFPELGIAVINPTNDTLPNLSAAIAQSDTLQIMEPERFVYAAAEVDLNWLKGFRDATNEIYERLANPSDAATPFLAQAGFDESQYTWGLQATQVLNSRETGKGVRVAVLDTGIDLNHADFRARAITTASFINDETVADGNGHGTHCAGIACGALQPSSLPRYGVAYEAELMVGKVLANSGRGTDTSIIAGINWAIANGADIISMSLGAPVQPGQNFSPIFQQIAQIALDRNVLIIAAAGNDSRRSQTLLPVSHPANCPGIMAVAAVDRNFRTAYFSNAGLNLNGGKVDIAGPGVDVYSSFPSGSPPYKRLDGTSQATPFVAWIAALYAQRYNLRGNALWAQLVRQALPLQEPARDVGAGLVQA